MCTVTFVPTENGFFLTQSRDVEPDRFATEIVDQVVSSHRIIYPKDPVGGGTWLTMGDRDLILCVMNGAFVPHALGASYRKSRGLVALEIHRFPSANDFFKDVDLHDIEPFTMIVYEKKVLYEFRWNGQSKFSKSVDISVPHIWASSTLYNAHWQERRQYWFDQWLIQNPQPSGENILDFHLHAGDGDPENDLVMNRSNLVCTVSISVVERTSQALQLDMVGLRNDTRRKAELPIARSEVV